jgi:hypothetical protein
MRPGLTQFVAKQHCQFRTTQNPPETGKYFGTQKPKTTADFIPPQSGGLRQKNGLPLFQKEPPGRCSFTTTPSPKEELHFNPFNLPYPLLAKRQRSPDNLMPALQMKPCLPPISILPILKEALSAGKIILAQPRLFPAINDTAGELQIARLLPTPLNRGAKRCKGASRSDSFGGSALPPLLIIRQDIFV